MKAVIIDYGAGNLRNVARALAHVGFKGEIVREPVDVLRADAVILPGVGATADTVRNLRETGLDAAIRDFVSSGRPFMGVCVGLQVLFQASDEGGEHDCLAILPGRVRRLPEGLKVPHIGWNRVQLLQEHPMFTNIEDGQFFYFVHSYYADVDDPHLVAAETEYGIRFPAVIIKNNLVATQFHPEKSGEAGLCVYYNFLQQV